MSSRRLSARVAAAVCLAWLTVSGGIATGAAPSDPVDLGGQTLPDGGDGSTNPAEPTELAPGLWQAEVSSDYPQYFTYQRRIKDSRVLIGVAGAPQSTDSDGIRLSAGVGESATNLTSCGDESDSSESSVAHAILGTQVIVGNESGSTGETCRADPTVQIQVSRGYGSNPEPMPYVVKVVEMAPFPPEGDDVEPDDEPDYTVPEPGSASEVPGAASYDEAPVLDARSGPVTISTTIGEGTELLWKVPLAWGDLPVVRVDVPVAEGTDIEGYATPSLSLHLVDPLLARLRYVDSGSDDSSTGEYAPPPGEDEPGEPDVLVASGFPVATINGQLPGDHWVSLAVEPAPEDREPVDVPVEITVEVTETGAEPPAFNSAVLSPANEAGPEGYDPATPFLIGEDTFSAVASGNPVADEEGDDEAWLTPRRWAGVGLGVLSVACLVGGLVRLRARR